MLGNRKLFDSTIVSTRHAARRQDRRRTLGRSSWHLRLELHDAGLPVLLLHLGEDGPLVEVEAAVKQLVPTLGANDRSRTPANRVQMGRADLIKD